MDSKIPFAADEGVPAYTEKAPDLEAPTHPPPSLSTLRTQRIQTVVDSTLHPHLTSQFIRGVYKRTLLLLPSDTLPTHPSLTSNDITSGIPTPGSDILLVRLPATSPPTTFWLHGSVPQDLSGLIRRKLRDMGHLIHEPPSISAASLPPPTSATQPSPSSPSAKTPKKSWFQRGVRSTKAQLSDEQDPNAVWTTDSKLGWRAEGEGKEADQDPWEGGGERGRELERDEVRVRAGVREVSFRITTEMGLWETVSARVVVVEVEVGAG